MKMLIAIVAFAFVGLAPAAAFACSYPVCTSRQNVDQWGYGPDDPDIPNCVAGSDHSYADGTCERVLQFLNFGDRFGHCEQIRSTPS